MDLLVPMCNLTALIDPQDSILELVAVGGGFVDANVDGQLPVASFFLQAQDKLALLYGLGEADAFGGGGGDVVAGFGEEEGLAGATI